MEVLLKYLVPLLCLPARIRTGLNLGRVLVKRAVQYLLAYIIHNAMYTVST